MSEKSYWQLFKSVTTGMGRPATLNDHEEVLKLADRDKISFPAALRAWAENQSNVRDNYQSAFESWTDDQSSFRDSRAMRKMGDCTVKSKSTKLFESLVAGMGQKEKGRLYKKAMKLAESEHVPFPVALESVITGKAIPAKVTVSKKVAQKPKKPARPLNPTQLHKKRKIAAQKAAATRRRNMTKQQRDQIKKNKRQRSISVVSGGRFSPR